jgi:hypothetical protein
MELPTKQTLDDIELFGNKFSANYTVLKQMFQESFGLACKYVVIGVNVDGDGNKTYRFHPNLGLYTTGEKTKMARYYEFLRESLEVIEELETADNIDIRDTFNTRQKLDYLVANALGGIISKC